MTRRISGHPDFITYTIASIRDDMKAFRPMNRVQEQFFEHMIGNGDMPESIVLCEQLQVVINFQTVIEGFPEASGISEARFPAFQIVDRVHREWKSYCIQQKAAAPKKSRPNPNTAFAAKIAIKAHAEIDKMGFKSETAKVAHDVVEAFVTAKKSGDMSKTKVAKALVADKLAADGELTPAARKGLAIGGDALFKASNVEPKRSLSTAA